MLALGPKAHHVIPSVMLTKNRHIRKTNPNSCHSERSEESAQPSINARGFVSLTSFRSTPLSPLYYQAPPCHSEGPKGPKNLVLYLDLLPGWHKGHMKDEILHFVQCLANKEMTEPDNGSGCLSCHSERSEESDPLTICPVWRILRFALNDMFWASSSQPDSSLLVRYSE